MGKDTGRFRVRGNRNGQATVEFALVIPIFIVAVLGLIDFSRYMFYDQSLAHTIRSGLRVAVTGQVYENPIYDEDAESGPASEEFLSRRETIIEAVRQNNVANIPIVANQTAADTLQITPADGGGPGDLVTVSLSYDFSFITPLIGTIADSASGKPFKIVQEATYQNEQYDE